MINWLGNYNYDYVLASIPIQLILLILYCLRRNLPVRSSYCFLWVMIANLVMTVFDVAACEMNAVWETYPLWAIYGINEIYFIAFIVRGWALFEYTAEECHGYADLGKWLTKFSIVPALITTALVLSTPWTHSIFRIDPGVGYVSSKLYNIIYVCIWLYISMSVLCVLLRWKKIDRRLKTSTLVFNLILGVGLLIRKLFMNTLVTSYFSILAILIIYLTAQNPDLYRDKKTHLFNGDAFNRIGADCILKGVPFHCIVVTINNYEPVKLLYGYQQMKSFMEEYGQWLISHFPHYYVFCLKNGDFLLLQKNHRFEDYKERILRTMEEHFSQAWRSENSDVQLSVSSLVLPYDLFPADMTKVHDFIVHTFNYAYVENRKGNYVVSQDICDKYYREGEVEKALSRALKQNRIEAWFQPIYSVEKDAVIGAEALARLKDPDLGYIPPDEFIRVSERTGEIMEVGRQVFERVCELLSTGEPGRLGINKINVNLSPAQCMNDQLAFELSAVADKYGVSLASINFEITETSFIDSQLIQKQMMQLKEKGATFSLDDFGTGTSNLIRLLKLPIRAVKLDIYMVNTFFKGESNILPSLVKMFREAGMQVVAEGVETREMKEALAEMGCDYEQGYYFSRPLPPKEFITFLADYSVSGKNGN